MTFKELVDEVLFDRFPEHKRGRAQGWVRTRHARVFAFSDWPFRRVGPKTVTVPAGPHIDLDPATIGQLMPAASLRGVFDEQGTPLSYVDSIQFEHSFQHADPGPPWAYTVVDEGEHVSGMVKRVYFGPPNDAARDMTFAFTRRLYHLDSAGAVVAGNLNDDGDLPCWPEDHHDLLYVGAAATGLKLEADSAWRALEDEYVEMLAVMVGDLVQDSGASNFQFGRDPL